MWKSKAALYVRACIHAQLEHHPAEEDDDEERDMWGRAVINVRGG